MNLRFKLIFPQLVGYVLIASILHFLWIPLLLSDAQKNYQKNVQLILASIEPEIIRNLISNDMATLHSFLNSQMQLHSLDWKALEISDNNNQLQFPFDRTNAEKLTLQSENIIEFKHRLNDFGSLWLIADGSQNKKAISKRFLELEFYLLFIFGVIIFISLLWQNLKISRPIKLLTTSVGKLAEGNYNVNVPDLGEDEVGNLASAFNNMLEQRRNYETKLKQYSAQTQQAFEELKEQKFALDQHAIVTTTDVKGIITYANDKFSKISGYSNEELINQNHRILNSGFHSKKFFKEMYQAISHGKIWHGEICNKAKDGHLYWVDSTIAPFMGADGKPQSYIAIRTDITSQKNIENDLILAKDIAENAARAKSEFLASMSHEIRTPMNGVLGMLNLLQNTQLDKEQTHRLSLAKSSAQSLLNLINDILDFSKVDAGKMELELLDFNLRSMLGELVESMMHQVDEKNLELILDTVGIDETMVKGDPGRLRQIIVNIINNAIKFTTQGEIVITVSVVEINDEKLQFNCSVRDTGIGIPKDKIDILFDSFSQVDSSTTRVYGGTGLGLAIVKKLCELMNGDISVSSEPNNGSCFELSVYLEKSHLSQQVLPTVDVKSLNLLIVDDNATNREVLRSQLEHWGATVIEAQSGDKALEICEQQWLDKNNNAFFDIGLLDMQMPGMDGAELGRILKSDSRFSSMKLIMMTSMGALGDAKFFSELGFSGYFPKPTTTTDLFEALSVVAEDGIALQKAEPLVTSHYLKTLIHNDEISVEQNIQNSVDKIRILLVEDNMVNQLVATGLLEEFGLKADVADNGLKALHCLEQAPESEPFNIVLMDCQMPEMDGYEATRQIRNAKAGLRYTNIPIIAMTANAMIGDKEKCLQAGMSDYLPKPIDPKQLLTKLQQGLGINYLTMKKPKLNSTEVKTEKSTIDWDRESALKRLLGKEDLFKQLLELFIEETPDRLQSLDEAIKSGDTQHATLLTHTIKGVAGNLGGCYLQQHAQKMEKLARENSMQELQLLMPLLVEITETLLQKFEDYLSAIDTSSL